MGRGHNVHSGTSASSRGGLFPPSQSETVPADMNTTPEQADGWVHISFWLPFFCLRSCWETSTVYCKAVESWISPKSGRSVWICVSISEGCSQHVQLPLKISMDPTSTEATTNLQPPTFFCFPHGYLFVLLLHIFCPSSPPPSMSIFNWQWCRWKDSVG